MNNQIEETEKEGIFDCIIKSFEIQKVLDIIKRVELKSLDDKEKVVVIGADFTNLKTLQCEIFNNGYGI